MRINEISKLTGYEFCGKDVDVESIRYAEWAEKNCIAIIDNPAQLEKTKAQCILTKPMLVFTDKSIIYSNDPIEIAAVKIGKVLQKNMEYGKNPFIYDKQNYFFKGENVYIGDNTFIGPNVCIDNNVIIENNCFIAANTHICSNVILKNGVKIGDGVTIGAESFYHYYDDGLQEFTGLGKVIIDENATIGNKTVIQRGTFSDTIIGARTKIGNLVEIGHDVVIGHDCKIVSQTGIASNVQISNYVTIYGQVGIANNISIGENAIVYAKSLVTKNVAAYQTVSGIYARKHTDELKTQAKIRTL